MIWRPGLSSWVLELDHWLAVEGNANPIPAGGWDTDIPWHAVESQLLELPQVVNWEKAQWERMPWQGRYLRHLRGSSKIAIIRPVESDGFCCVQAMHWRKTKAKRGLIMNLRWNVQARGPSWQHTKRILSPTTRKRTNGGSRPGLNYEGSGTLERLAFSPQQVYYTKIGALVRK